MQDTRRRGYWDIEALVPMQHPNGLQNFRLGIVATGMDQAVAAFKAKHPRARIWATRMRGEVDIVVAKDGRSWEENNAEK